MRTLATVGSTAALSVVVAGSISSTALAWHPAGMITKSVENVTTHSAVSDANTSATAVAAKPGDILQYTVEIKNIAPAADKHYNDMAYVGLSDYLPSGVELVDSPNVRVVTAQPENILPGKSYVKTFKVKVTETTDGKVIVNQACYSADSVVKDKPMNGCDTADVKVSNPTPVTPITPVTPVTPPTTPTPVTPAVGSDVPAPESLPSVGAGFLAPIAGGLTAFAGFAANTLRLKRRR